MWKKYSLPRQTTDDNIIRSMRFACLITNATGTHSENVILIVFPRQQMVRERASMLRYTCIACLVLFTTADPVESTPKMLQKLPLNLVNVYGSQGC